MINIIYCAVEKQKVNKLHYQQCINNFQCEICSQEKPQKKKPLVEPKNKRTDEGKKKTEKAKTANAAKDTSLEARIIQGRILINKYYEQYQKERNGNIVIKLLKEYPLAVNEEWVHDEIGEWIKEKNCNFLKNLSPGKGRGSDSYIQSRIRDMLIFVIVENLKKEGKKPDEAYKIVLRKFRNEGFSIRRIENICSAVKEKMPPVWFGVKDGIPTLEADEAKIEFMLNGVKFVGAGRWTITKDKP